MKNISASHDAQAAGRDIFNDNSQVIIFATSQADEPQFAEQSQWIVRLMQLDKEKREDAIAYSHSIYGTGKFRNSRKDPLFDVEKKIAGRQSFKCEFCNAAKELVAERESEITVLRKKLLAAYAVIVFAVASGLISAFAFK